MDLNNLAARIFKHGQFLETIEYYNRRVNLYSVDNEFYELYYDVEENTIEKIALAGDDELSKFLNRISFSL